FEKAVPYSSGTRVWESRDRQSEGGVELVDLAVRLDAEVVLRNPATAEECGLSVVARARVDLHCRLARFERSRWPASAPRAAPPSDHSSQRSRRRTFLGVHSSPS